LLPYYLPALEKTEQDIIKNVRQKFVNKIDWDNLDLNNPEIAQMIRKKFINYVMSILKCDCIDEWRKEHKKSANPQKSSTRRVISLEEIVKNQSHDDGKKIEDFIADPTLSGLDLIIQQDLQEMGRKLIHYIETDPDNILKNCHVRNHPECHCQILLKMRLLEDPPLTTKAIAEHFNLSESTIVARLRRNCFPLLRQQAQNLGYNQEK
jgi:hypothetical protein